MPILTRRLLHLQGLLLSPDISIPGRGGCLMKPGFTMAEATENKKKITMRQERIAHIKLEIERLNDCITIMEDEIKEYEK